MWLIPVFLVGVLFVWGFYPGFVSPDALFQYAQMKSGQLSNLHPPLMAWLWRGTDLLIPGPGGLFLLYAVIYLIAAAAIARNLKSGWYSRFSCFGLMLAPPVTAVLMSLWKDSLMLTMLMVAAACILSLQRHQQWRWFWTGLFALWLAALLRHNALPAIVPLVFLLFHHVPQVKVHLWLNIIKTLAVAVLFALSGPQIEKQHQVTRISMLPTVALWDLAAISLHDGQMLIPPYALGWQGMSLARLNELFSPISNVPLCQFTPGIGREVLCMEKIPLRHGRALSSDQAQQLQQDWLALISAHSQAYLDHRTNLWLHLIGIRHDPSFIGFNVSSTQPEALSGNWYEGPAPQVLGIHAFALPSARGQFIASGMQLLQQFSPLLRPWPYLLILLVCSVVFLVRQQHNPLRATALGLCISGWMMLLPLFFIAPNAQLRYAIWPIVCALIVMHMMRQSSRKRKRSRASTPHE